MAAEVTEDTVLHIELLGNFRLACGGDVVTDVDTPRLQALLAYLLLHRGAPQSRHRLAFLFWPDSSDRQALTNLRNLLYRLRNSLPDADRFLDVERQTLRWRIDSPFDLDVARFEAAVERADGALEQNRDADARRALEQATRLYGGDLLPSCYDDWIESERRRLRQAFERVSLQLTELLEDQQDYVSAIEVAERLVRHDPLREVAYRRLMRLRALIGDRAGALRTYHRCATVLEQELGVEPGPATREIYEGILAAEGPARPGRAQPGRATGASSLVGRQRAWSELRSAWRVASAGEPRFVLISGEAGIGKTRLAEELSQWASRQGARTAVARCYAGEGELAYSPVAAWLRALPRPGLAPVWREELARILPEIAAEDPAVSPAGPLSEPWQRRRFFEALARGILEGGQPLLLTIDALQWCDQETLDWLHYLLRFELTRRLLLVGTYRPEGGRYDHALTALLHQLRHDEQLTEIELPALSRGETAELAENLAGRHLESTLIDCLYGETEGSPLFIVETVRAGLPEQVTGSPSEGFVCVPRPLPSRMVDALMARIDQLSPLARGLAELAATIGREFTFDVLMAASDGGEEMLIRGLDELWQRRIVREQGEDAYDFSHDKLREVICAQLSEARRRMLHRHVARALETVYARDLDAVAARIAAHCERAEEWDEAIAYYERAARVAKEIEAREDAARYRRRAQALQQQSRPEAG